MKIKLLVDLGQSEIRGIAKVGTIRTSKRMEKLFVFPNSFSKATNPERYSDKEDYSLSDSTLLSIQTPDRKYGGQDLSYTVASGRIRELEFAMSALKFSQRVPKVHNATSYFAIFSLIEKTLDWVVKEGKFGGSIKDLSQEVVFSLTILLPPSQKDLWQDEFKDQLLGTHVIQSYIPKTELKININSVTFVQEGVSAYFGLVLRKDSFKQRPLASKLKDAVVLLVDIGASTTDLVVINKGITIETSRHTITVGGNAVLSALRVHMQKIVGDKISDDTLFSICQTGLYRNGSQVIDLVNTINEFKNQVSDSINTAIVNYLDSADFDTYLINRIVVIGGNTMESENEGIKSLGKLLMEQLRINLATADVIDISEEDFSDLDLYHGGDTSQIGRRINLYGASISDDVQEVRYLKEEQKRRESEAVKVNL